MIFKNLLRRKTRTLLTVIGIAIGVAAVVALGALAEGFINSYTTVLTSSGADIIVSQGDAADLLFSAVDETVAPQLAYTPGVRKISGVLWGMVTTPDVPYFIVVGLDPKEFGMAHFKVTEGQAITGQRQMLLGKTAAKNFKKRVGENYKIQETAFKIVGIYETGQGVEEMGAVIPLREAQDIFKKPRQVTYYQLKVARPEMITSVIKDIERRFPKLAASRSANFMDEQQETQMLRAMGWFISFLAVLGGGLGMMNTMLMSVFERTREIGVLRALGWRRRRILQMILGEALLLCSIGGALGISLGTWLTHALNQVPALAGMLDAAITPALIVQAITIALLLGIASGLYPAWRAAQLQPVEAMRYEGSQVQGSKFKIQLPISNLQFGGLALRNIFRQRTRALLTALAIGVGVGMVVALGGMGEGMAQQFGDIGARNGELTISEAKASDMSLTKVDEKVGRWVATLPAVQSVSGALLGFTTMPGMAYFLAFGIEPTSFAMQHYNITEGERIRTPRDILLGKVAAKNLKKKVGDVIQVSGASFRVVGIYETGTGYEDAASVITLSEAQKLFKRPNQVSWYFIKLKDPSQAEMVARHIEAKFPGVTVTKSSEYVDKTNDMQTFRSMTAALSFLSILIGGVGIMNAMLMSVFERTREIGTLRALGWRRRRVVGMIVRESLTLSFFSGLVGIALGIGLGRLMAAEPTMGSFLAAVYTPPLFAQALLVALTLGMLGALYPAWRAANLSPIEALRYE